MGIQCMGGVCKGFIRAYKGYLHYLRLKLLLMATVRAKSQLTHITLSTCLGFCT
jgi:hypothetical protein